MSAMTSKRDVPKYCNSISQAHWNSKLQTVKRYHVKN